MMIAVMMMILHDVDVDDDDSNTDDDRHSCTDPVGLDVCHMISLSFAN
jgi:hypothetical protein